MSERWKLNLRFVLIALAAANVLFFAYGLIASDPSKVAASRIEELQINPGRIGLMRVATRGPGGAAAKSACLEWGPFAAPDAARAEAAIARLSLPQPAMQRSFGETGGGRRFAYFVREPDARIVAQIAELQRSFPGTEIKAGPCPG